MSDSPFSYVLSDDKSKLKLVSHAGEFEYSAVQVARLAMWFANLRAEMTPPILDNPSDPSVDIQCDRYEVLQDPQTGTAQVYLRIPGFAWPYIQFSKEQCIAMAETLNPQAAPPEAAMH